jgi:hypothetical protein
MGRKRDTETDEQVVAEGVELHKTADGVAYLLPRAVKGLTGRALERYIDLQDAEREIWALREHQDDYVRELRAAGVSWASLGFAVGITGEAARKRWDVRATS